MMMMMISWSPLFFVFCGWSSQVICVSRIMFFQKNRKQEKEKHDAVAYQSTVHSQSDGMYSRVAEIRIGHELNKYMVRHYYINVQSRRS